jgi:amidophosphoribosyltransferase
MCGIFGIFGTPDAAHLIAIGLRVQQHRGQDACGITVFEEGDDFHTIRKLGLVNFAGEEFGQLTGTSGVGHVRYPTSGKKKRSMWRVQPFFKKTMFGGLAIAHNGNFPNADALREEVLQKGATLQTSVDTEILFPLMTMSTGVTLEERLVNGLKRVRGAYSLVILTEQSLIGIRDPFGFRPMVLGERSGAFILASETCAIEKVGAHFIRDILPGEMVVITKEGIESTFPFSKQPTRHCIFEVGVYFSAPQSVVDGLSTYSVRKKVGMRLAQESLVSADVIVPIPDSGIPAALGFSQESGIPFEMGVIRDRYFQGRTFILPTEDSRQSGVKEKHLPNRAVLEGRRVILVDDSLVRGNTLKRIVQMVRESKALDVHVRIASPPVTHPCVYGIDTPSKEGLLASRMSVEEMRVFLGADSLAFVSLEGLHEAVGGEDSPACTRFCNACFTGNYPER